MSDLLIGVDTNILVRYLTRDDEEQVQHVDRLVEEVASGPPLFVNPVTLAETVWVLRKVYKFGRSESQHACQLLLDTPEFYAPQRLATGNFDNWFLLPECDFTDVLIAEINRANGCQKTVTFDKTAARRIPAMELLK